MLSFNILIIVALCYVAGLFAVAFLAERRAAQGYTQCMPSPEIYTLSLSIYCTAWTFYGAVGYAARSGLDREAALAQMAEAGAVAVRTD